MPRRFVISVRRLTTARTSGDLWMSTRRRFRRPMATDNIIVEKDRPNRPHEGKVFLAVQAHLDDVIHNCAGLCAKLIHEGYTGYVVRTSNDEKRGGRSTAG